MRMLFVILKHRRSRAAADDGSTAWLALESCWKFNDASVQYTAYRLGVPSPLTTRSLERRSHNKGPAIY
jgi:hypothetical protein